MKKFLAAMLVWVAGGGIACAQNAAAPLKVGIVGLVHGHAAGFMNGGALAPAGGLLTRKDVEVVGIVEPNQQVYDSYAAKFHLAPSLHFASIADMVAQQHPQAVMVFTAASDHRRVVEECAKLGVHVMMEKPLAFSYDDALAMQRAAERGKIHVLVDYETTWYPSNTAANRLLQDGSLGPVVKTVFRDGHQGPKKIHVQPEFLAWLTDPKQNGDGALTDFGCYGVDLMTWMMHGAAPISVTAVTKRMQPDDYPNVDDEAEIVLNYPHAVSIVEGSWNWPIGLKQMDVYGRIGYAKALDANKLEVRRQGDHEETLTKEQPLAAPYDDPLHYLAAVLSGQVDEQDGMSSLKTNVTAAEILDAAWRSAKTGKTVMLPLTH